MTVATAVEYLKEAAEGNKNVTAPGINEMLASQMSYTWFSNCFEQRELS